MTVTVYSDNAMLHICISAQRSNIVQKSYQFFIVIASGLQKPLLLLIVIASYCYRSRLKGKVITFYSYGSDNITKAITSNAVTF